MVCSSLPDAAIELLRRVYLTRPPASKTFQETDVAVQAHIIVAHIAPAATQAVDRITETPAEIGYQRSVGSHIHHVNARIARTPQGETLFRRHALPSLSRAT